MVLAVLFKKRIKLIKKYNIDLKKIDSSILNDEVKANLKLFNKVVLFSIMLATIWLIVALANSHLCVK